MTVVVVVLFGDYLQALARCTNRREALVAVRSRPDDFITRTVLSDADPNAILGHAAMLPCLSSYCQRCVVAGGMQ